VRNTTASEVSTLMQFHHRIAGCARAGECGKTMTFDRIAARDAGMQLIV